MPFGTVFAVAPLLGVAGLIGAGEFAPLLFTIPFWAMGIAIAIPAINMGRRHALVGVVQDSLLVKRTNPFGTKAHEWHRDAIESIEVGPSSMTVNNRPVLELQIDSGGKKHRFWAGRDEQELHWIAAVLRDGLQREA